MIDPKDLRDNLDKIIEMLDKRNLKFPLNDLINLDKKRRELIASLQLERHKKNNIANVYVLCTHALLLDDAKEKLLKADIKELISTNSIPNEFAKVDLSGVISDYFSSH